ncbi:hypothetical protein [Thermogemmatispora sp.]|nr:hypothetical protein [Thermogemmatispora sp.]
MDYSLSLPPHERLALDRGGQPEQQQQYHHSLPLEDKTNINIEA